MRLEYSRWKPSRALEPVVDRQHPAARQPDRCRPQQARAECHEPRALFRKVLDDRVTEMRCSWGAPLLRASTATSAISLAFISGCLLKGMPVALLICSAHPRCWRHP